MKLINGSFSKSVCPELFNTTISSNGNSTTDNGRARLLWGSWSDYPKQIVDTPNGPQEFAVVGERLYSQHAVARMQPSGQRYTSGPPAEGTAPPLTGNLQPYVNSPGIQTFDGNQNIRGRSISPSFVEDIIQNTKALKQSNGNWNYRSGNLQVILSPDKKRVITVLDIH
ncbi:hypothetical protein [Enterovibrio norvegicus]|uniref:hypothetical protein n=1 Tax=Enterovibrio norvegicus TaxID=188144 RepID=UPI0013D1F1E7|nr:hypothetical protein [Enterovibrio norvegicus]